MQILHTCINVSSLETALDFYIGELGFEKTWSFEMELGGQQVTNQYIAPDEGDTEIQLKYSPDATDLEVGDAWDHIGVTVDDIDAALEDIDHYGLVTGPLEVEAAGAKVAFINDPDGHVVELIEKL